MDSQWDKKSALQGLKCALSTGLIIAAVGGSGLVAAGSDAAGGDDFKYYCASCHGVSGVGDGPVADSLKNKPANLTTLAAANGGTFPKKHVTDVVQGNKDYDQRFRTHGPSDMPVWGKVIYDDSDDRVSIANARIKNIVNYIEALQK